MQGVSPISTYVADSYALDVSEAKLVNVTPTVSIWVVPGSNGICTVVVTPQAVGCSSTAATLAGNNIGELIYPSSETVYGIAPDGNAKVSITTASGQIISVPVVDNVYAYTGERATSVSLDDSTGSPVTEHLGGPAGP
jgi:hypothetical protein